MRNLSCIHCIVFLVLFCIVAFVFAAETGQLPQQVKDLQEVAQDCASKGDIVQAVDYYRKVIQTDPSSSYALVAQRKIITAYLQGNQGDKAIVALAEMKQKYASRPEYVQQVHELGWDFIQKGDYATGVQVYQDLQKEFPNHPRVVWFQRSIVQTYLEQGDMEKADQSVEKLKTDFQSHPDYINQMTITADRLRGKKQYTIVAGIYDTLLKQQPDNDKAVIWKRMQIVNALDMGQTDKAKSDVEVLFVSYKEKPEFVKQAHELGWDFVQKRDYSTALKIYTDLQKQFPNHERVAWLQRSITQTYFEQGDTNKALEAVEQLKTNFQSSPDYVNQMEALVGILVDKKQPAAAKGVCETLLEKFPNHSRLPWFLQAKARGQVWMKDPNSADVTVVALQQQCGGNSDYADAMSWTAYEYRRAGFYKRAIELYESLLAQNPGQKVQVRSIASIAQACAHLGDDKKVLEKVDTLLSQYGKSQPDAVAFYVFGIGEEYYLMAEESAKAADPNQINVCYEKALAIWQMFEQAVPNHNSPHYTYFSGITCQRLAKYEHAIAYFQRVISKWPSYEQTWHARHMTILSIESLAKAGRMDRAKADSIKQSLYQEILQRNPESPAAEVARKKVN